MKRVEILAPMTGRVVPIDEVPDPVFAERMIGDGVAIEPTGSVGVAPISGTLVVFHSAGHAFAIEGENGVSVLVHVGLDTVNLKGRGFTRLAEAGDAVTAGQELVRFDLSTIAAEHLSALSPVVLPQLDPTYRVSPTTADEVEAGRDVLLTVELPDPVPA